MLVQNRGLLVIAAIVWLIAGVNVFIVGLNAGYASWDVPLIAGTSVVFVVFLLMFLRITQRNATRLTAHGNERSSIIWFMDGRSYLVMAFMIALGIGLRLLAPVPSGVIAFFYTGLG
ncbi:MAG: hypothetical protein LBS58_01125, partial [Coriobacteriales bacterium]|nr:hypothetical protein [Coriobacteriales bacterium]